MPDQPVVLTANSTATLSSSSEDTRNSIMSAVPRLHETFPHTTRRAETGDYVTHIGDAVVVWRKADDRIVVLTVFAPNG
jgi:hypothetical protein